MMPHDPSLEPFPSPVPERLPRVERPVEAHYSVAGSRVPARIEDLSEGGAYVDTLHPLYVGTPLTVEVELPVAGTPTAMRLDAEVVWTNNGLGAGIAFRSLDDETRSQLRFYLASVLFGHLDA